MKTRTIDVAPLWAAIPSGGTMVVRHLPFKVTFLKSPEGTELISFYFDAKVDINLQSTRGFETEVNQEGEGTELLLRRAEVNDDVGLFFTLAEDLVCIGDNCEALSQEGCASAVISRIDAWQQFLKAEGKTLSDQKELGLFGELFLLRDWLTKGGAPSDFHCVWTGPAHGARDFSFPNGDALEVKTTIVEKPLKVTIESLEQLNTEDFPNLSLITVQVDVVENGISLFNLFEDICDLLNHGTLRLEFESILVSLGYRPRNPGRELRHFVVNSIRSFRAATLPRLLPNQIKGLVKANYDILIMNEDLTLVENVQEEEYEERMLNLTKKLQG